MCNLRHIIHTCRNSVHTASFQEKNCPKKCFLRRNVLWLAHFCRCVEGIAFTSVIRHRTFLRVQIYKFHLYGIRCFFCMSVAFVCQRWSQSVGALAALGSTKLHKICLTPCCLGLVLENSVQLMD